MKPTAILTLKKTSKLDKQTIEQIQQWLKEQAKNLRNCKNYADLFRAKFYK